MAGLSVTGFTRKRLPELKDELEAAIQAAFPNADLSAASLIGQVVGVTAQTAADLWELLEQVYLSQSAASAEGVSLESLTSLVGVFRLGSSKATATESASGDEGTVIPAGSLVKNATSQFETLEDATITAAAADRVRIAVTTATNGADYTVTVDGVPVTITATTADAASIMAQIAAAIDATPANADTDPDGIECDILATGDPISVTVGTKLAVIEQAAQIRVRALADGETDVSAGAIAQIVTPVSGWDSVTNRWAGINGRLIESDSALRARRRTGVRGPGSAAGDAMVARMLQEVPNLLTAKLYENRTGGVVSGRPAHSYELVAEGADSQDIADAIWRLGPAGIESYGTITKTVADAAGNAQSVKFTRPAPKYVWAKVTILSYNAEETFPAIGADQITAAIVEAGNRLGVGEDVITQKMLAAVYSVPGIADVTLEWATSATAAGPPGAYSAVNLGVGAAERAKFSPDRVSVTV